MRTWLKRALPVALAIAAMPLLVGEAPAQQKQQDGNILLLPKQEQQKQEKPKTQTNPAPAAKEPDILPELIKPGMELLKPQTGESNDAGGRYPGVYVDSVPGSDRKIEGASTSTEALIGAPVHPWLKSLPVTDSTRKQLMALPEVGERRSYRNIENSARSRIPGEMVGWLVHADADPGTTLVEIGERVSGKGLNAGPDNKWFLHGPSGSYYKRIVDGRGKPFGTISIHPGAGGAVALDVNDDRIIDLVKTLDFELNSSLIVNEAGKKFLDAWLGRGMHQVCDARSGAEAGGLTGAAVAPPPGSMKGCDTEGAGGSGSSGGGMSVAGGGGSSSATDPRDRLGDRCTQALAKGPPGGGRPGPGGTVMGDNDPRTFDWGDGLIAMVDSVVTNTPEEVVQDGIKEIVKALGGASLVTATTATQAVGAFLEGGTEDFVNEADRDLYYFERQAEGTDAQPDPAVVDSACAAGSTSPYCEGWSPPTDSGSGGESGGGGSSSGGGASQPGPDGDEQSVDALEYERCRQRAETLRAWGLLDQKAAPSQRCANPASDPATTASADGGGEKELATFCSDAERQQAEGGFQQMMDRVLGSNGGECRDQPGDGARECEPALTPLGSGTGRGSSGIAFGAILGMDCAANPACDPSSVQ